MCVTCVRKIILCIITKTSLFKYTENFTTKNKNENFQIKILIFFHISAQNINCWYSLEPPRRGCSNEYPQSMFLSRNKKYNVYPCKPQIYYIKVGLNGVNIIRACFRDVLKRHQLTRNSLLFAIWAALRGNNLSLPK